MFTASTHNSRSFGLDLMRSLAILFVLLSHFVHKWNFLGFLGVEIFFALSGFLIGGILWRTFSESNGWSGAQVLNFWQRRWWRTLPNYYLFLIVNLIFHPLYYHTLPSFSYLVKFLWFGTNLLTHRSDFFNVSWSLAVEEWLYLLFPLILFCLSRFIPAKHSAYVFSILTIILGCTLIRQYLLTTPAAHHIRGITLARLDAIGYGIALSYALTILRLDRAERLLLFCFGIILMAAPFWLSYLSEQSLATYLPTHPFLLTSTPLGAALLLPLTLQIPRPNLRILGMAINRISLWSYSIYLCHVPIMMLAYKFVSNTTLLGAALPKLVGIVVTIVLSGLLYHYFEHPLTKRRPAELTQKPMLVS
ncbi:acyltransferase [Spirosoma sp. KNUC1025]|uniref:acyltransferase family protein n=1 Tax=Spirosoma sp. KNUC1025 TaxID=2894082 RepID=UPI0038699FE0|nr:acyltransferase [Spirosoma sp. KNUC1025]